MIKRILERLEDKKKNYSSHVTNRDDVCMADGIEIAIKIVKEEAKNGGWIACDKQLPEDQEIVLAKDEEGNVQVCKFFAEDKEFRLTWDMWKYKTVVTWRPMSDLLFERGNENE